MNWTDWAAGVLSGISAPVDQTNVDTLFAWSNAESGPNLLRWNNPLNTTLPWPGSIDQNSVGVKYYLTVQDGIGATVNTLANGYYPVILDHLRRSVPRQQWQDACPNLGTWGTGCGWLNYAYGDAPRVAGEEVLNTDQANELAALYSMFFGDPTTGNAKVFWDRVKAAVQAELATQPAGSAAAVDLSPVLAAQSVTNAKVDVVAGTMQKIESALKGA